MGYSPALCSKSANFRHFRIHPKSTKTVAEAFANHFRIVLEGFQRVSNDFQEFKKSAMFKTMGYSPALCSKSANFRHLRIQRKSTQIVAEAVILERFWRRFREFRTISRSWKNRPCSKPWAIPQAFCSKSAKFQPLQMHLESRQKVAQGDTNNFRTVLEAFQSVWRDFQDFTKSAMFKTMGYSPDLLLKIGQFSTLGNSP